MLKPYSNILLICLAIFVTGCAGTGGLEVAEPVIVELPDDDGSDSVVITDEAIADFKAGLRISKNDGSAAAKDYWLDYTRTYPDVPGGHLNLAFAYYHLSEKNNSLDSVQTALELSPRNAPAYTLLGTLQRERGEFRESRISYSKALVANPDLAEAHLNIGILYDIYLQYLLDARTHYNRYVELGGARSDTVKQWLQDLEFRIKRAGRR